MGDVVRSFCSRLSTTDRRQLPHESLQLSTVTLVQFVILTAWKALFAMPGWDNHHRW